MFKELLKQHNLPVVGPIKNILAQTLFYFNAINFAQITTMAYWTTYRSWILVHVPWLSLPILLGFLLAGIALMMVLEYKFVATSFYTFQSKQMDIAKKLDEILKELRK